MMSTKYKETVAACDSLLRQGVNEDKINEIVNKNGYWEIPYVETPTERVFHKAAKQLSKYSFIRMTAKNYLDKETYQRIDFHYQFSLINNQKGRSNQLLKTLKINFPKEFKRFNKELRLASYQSGNTLDILLKQ